MGATLYAFCLSDGAVQRNPGRYVINGRAGGG
jgi:hypothetical protein